MLSFALSLDDLVIAMLVSGPGATTVPMVVYSSLMLRLAPKLNALTTIIVALVALALFAAGALGAWSGQRLSRLP